jgi:type IV pilus assembly protein PilB
MVSKIQSIEDLINSSQGGDVAEESIEGKFAIKEREIKLKELERATKSAAQNLGFSYISLGNFPISPEALSLISEEDARRLGVVCFYFDGQKLRLGVIDPSLPEIKIIYENLLEKFYAEGDIYLVSENSLAKALDLYRALPKVRKFISGVEISPVDFEKFKNEISDYRSLNEKINSAIISDIITLIIATAVKADASDIHIEDEEKTVIVRLRIDGVLHEAAKIDTSKWERIISRLKLLAKVKINISNKPQDGRFTIYLHKEKMEVRVSFLPTAYGESVVMRLLRSGSIGVPFEALGLSAGNYAVLHDEIKKPNGMILTTGPTGSGKTTTLYAVLNKLNTQETKIITLEDPIEYKLEGINQSQIDVNANYTFSKGLRSILRQDPDIVMVGEMRDLETAEIAVQASLTGHLVLSTLHTNDAAGVIPRMIEMGIKPYLIVPSVNCIIGQRLVRKLCPFCKEEHKMSEQENELIKKILATISPRNNLNIPAELPKFFKKGKGCAACNFLGYKGRIGIYEILTMTNEIKKLTSENAPSFRILEQAIEDGMVTMLQDGILKCLEGLTDTEEIYRVIGKFDYIDALYDIAISKTIGRGVKIEQSQEILSAQLIADLAGMPQAIKKVQMSDMMNIVLASAILIEASDIHIDPSDEDVRIRFRLDGILHDIASMPKEQYLSFLSKIKLLANISTNFKKATYDGRFNVFFASDKKKIDCRLSIISGGYGETVVIRVLSEQASSLRVEDLGIKEHALSGISQSIRKTKGIIITTGPTGSGKTTTLYSLLNKINSPDLKIITIEDPIEYHLDGVMQTQINEESGYTFATALKSLLRQNPNVIMIGEIRDDETAKIAIEAAMTGHLVLSTIHANSSAGAIARFKGLGVEGQLLANSFENFLSQRLVRKICPSCKIEDHLAPEIEQEVDEILKKISPQAKIILPKKYKFYKGAGCEKCGHLGYKGRIGIYESIRNTDEIGHIILQDKITEKDIEAEAIKGGMITLLQDGLLKALNGETSVEEVFRVAK